MCDYTQSFRLFEYVHYASRKYGLPEGWLTEKLDRVYAKVGNSIFAHLKTIDDIVSNWKGKEDIVNKILTSLPEEVDQEY